MPMFIAYRRASPRRTPLHARSRGPHAPLRSRGSFAQAHSRSWRVLQQTGSPDRFADDDPLGPGDAGQRAELRVAALDQLPERRRAQARGDGAPALGLKLGAVTRQRLALPLVMRRDVDDE